jgi:formate hydrogenlyase transcriptional activator
MHKAINSLPTGALNELLKNQWPGNIRELQNFIERAVILSPGKMLRLPLSELRAASSLSLDCPVNGAVSPAVSLKDAEREHILQALAETNWIVGGNNGAASRLGLKRTTLLSKMQKLGISRAMA